MILRRRSNLRGVSKLCGAPAQPFVPKDLANAKNLFRYFLSFRAVARAHCVSPSAISPSRTLRRPNGFAGDIALKSSQCAKGLATRHLSLSLCSEGRKA